MFIYTSGCLMKWQRTWAIADDKVRQDDHYNCEARWPLN